MPAWYLTESHWWQTNVKFKTIFLTKLDLGRKQSKKGY